MAAANPKSSRRNFYPAGLPFFLGIFLLATGTCMLLYRQFSPSALTPLVLKANTAFCYAVLGAVLCLLEIRKTRGSLWVLIPAALAALSIAESMLRVDLRIDYLFYFTHASSADGWQLVRMTRMSAVGILCGSLVLLPFQFLQPNTRTAIEAIVGTLMISVSGVNLISYAIDLPTIYAWGVGNNLPPSGAILLGILGAALLLRAWRQYRAIEPVGIPSWLPLLAMLTSATITVLVWIGLRDREHVYLYTETQNDLNAYASTISLRIDHQLTDMERLARRWSQIYPLTNIVREADAISFLESSGSIRRLIWISPKGETQWVYPTEGNEGLVGFRQTSDPIRAQALRTAVENDHAVISASLLSPEGRPGFMVYAPVYHNGTLSGLIGASVDYQRFFGWVDEQLGVSQGHRIILSITGDTVYQAMPKNSQVSASADSLSSVVTVYERRIRIELTPSIRQISENRRYIPELALGSGLGFTLLLGLSIRLARSAYNGMAALRVSQALARKLSLVASKTDNLVIIATPDGRIEWINESFERVLGYSIETVRARPLEEFVMEPDSPAELRQRVSDAIARRRGLFCDVTNRSVDGQRYHLHLELQPVFDEAGTLENFIAVQADITARVQTENELHRAKEKVDAASRAKSEFLASMSHEIRTPMNGVVGMTSLLLDTPLDTEQRDYVNAIRASGDSLITIINGILDFSKIEAGQMALEQAPFNLETCIEETLDLFGAMAASKGLDQGYFIAPEVSSRVEGDATRLRQILANLVNNAIKFTDAGSVSIEVTLAPSGHFLFEVIDTGIGIPSERFHRLFRPFSQVDSSTTRKYGGTGLGLAICERLCRLMGGSIRVSSVVGRGSVFSVELPLTPGGENPEAPAAPRLSPQTVAILEQNSANRRRYAALVERLGLSAQIFPDEESLRSTLSRGRIDIVLIDDIHMRSQPLAHALAEASCRVFLQTMPGRSLPLTRLSRSRVKLLRKPVKNSVLVEALESLEDRPLPGPADSQSPASALPTLAERIPLKILLVEDNLVNQKVGMRFLERLGYAPELAADGHGAIEAVRARPCDLVFMDLHMPDMDGVAVTQFIRQHLPQNRQPCIIALTADALADNRQECLAAGMNDHLTKPIKLEAIEAVIERHFSGKA